jgi:polysaccharide deacetylase family protein (PEP-CTERM system associated)
MEEEKPKASRLRRSRFRTPKAPPEVGAPEEAEQSPGREEAAPASAPPATAAAAAPPPPPPPPPQGAAVPQYAVEPQPDFPPPIDVPVAPHIPVLLQREVTNILTIDVKEWFQTSTFSNIIKLSHWNRYERRVESGVNLILALLQHYEVKATFFVLGIVAREFPEIVRMIANAGHEIGTMGYYNRMLHSISPKDYINEIEMSLSLLGSITRKNIEVHRAPEWSATERTLWYLEILKTYGIKVDSSIYPINATLYGIEKAPRFPYKIEPYGIIEYPPSTMQFAGKNVALFGGVCMRVLPYRLISLGINTLNRDGNPAMVHVSPWEIDGEFPKVDVGWDGYLSQYAGIKSTFSRLTRLLNEFKFERLSQVIEEKPPVRSIPVTGIGRGKDLFKF